MDRLKLIKFGYDLGIYNKFYGLRYKNYKFELIIIKYLNCWIINSKSKNIFI